MDPYDIGAVETKIENPALSASGAEPFFSFYSCQFCWSLSHHFVSKSCHNLHHHCRLKYAMQKISSIIRYKNSLLNESWRYTESWLQAYRADPVVSLNAGRCSRPIKLVPFSYLIKIVFITSFFFKKRILKCI